MFDPIDKNNSNLILNIFNSWIYLVPCVAWPVLSNNETSLNKLVLGFWLSCNHWLNCLQNIELSKWTSDILALCKHDWFFNININWASFNHLYKNDKPCVVFTSIGQGVLITHLLLLLLSLSATEIDNTILNIGDKGNYIKGYNRSLRVQKRQLYPRDQLYLSCSCHMSVMIYVWDR